MNIRKLTFSIVLALASNSAFSDELMRNGDFATNSIDGWWNAGASVIAKEGEACIFIKNPGANSWDVILGHGGIGLANDEIYKVSFNAYATVDTEMKSLIQHEGAPYTHYFVNETKVSTEKKATSLNLKMN